MLFALDPLPPANLLAARDQMAVTLGFRSQPARSGPLTAESAHRPAHTRW